MATIKDQVSEKQRSVDAARRAACTHTPLGALTFGLVIEEADRLVIPALHDAQQAWKAGIDSRLNNLLTVGASISR
ncbi:hypothetical protein [uncultured Lamprocystis sp.]|jgi:hypothetical protein|uniref:hypothetical protein n=1 Tax=uncultured Lamprocystis sp. TaxID=543132 RepID=UPI0025DC1318|nr:hypothetical protein [uncultured Lamprocystis sp.]